MGDARSVGVRVSLLYFVYFLSDGVCLPYLPVAMKRMGFDQGQIGQVLAASLLIQLLAPPLWGFLADRTGGGRWILPGVAALGAVSMIVAAIVPAGTPFLVAYMFFCLARSPVGPVLDSLALSHPGLGPSAYGRLRRWGSLGFLLTASGAGLFIDGHSTRWIPASVGIIWLIFLVLTLGGPREDARVPAGRLPLRSLYGRPAIWIFLGAASLHMAAMVPFHSHFANMALERGVGGHWVGLSWFGGVGLEILVLTRLGGLVERLGARPLLLIALVLSVLRWILTAYCHDGLLLAAVQLSHGITFGAFFGASVLWMNRSVGPELRVSSQGLLYSIAFGFGGILGQLASGHAHHHLGSARLFELAAVAELIPLCMLVFLREPPVPDDRGP